jgi:hypothetical protein
LFARPAEDMVTELVRENDELRASLVRLAAAAAAERRRIERDLHDGAQQQLTCLSVRLLMAAKLAAGQPDLASLLGELGDEAAGAARELRNLAHGIYPPVLRANGLADALFAAASHCPLPTTVRIGSLGRYPADIEAAVYFCCLEAMQNACKHAGERATIRLQLREEPAAVAFEVIDDGAGFDAAGRGPGAGLLNMADRLGAFGGTLRVDSAPGMGTRIAGTVPVITGRGLRTGSLGDTQNSAELLEPLAPRRRPQERPQRRVDRGQRRLERVRAPVGDIHQPRRHGLQPRHKLADVLGCAGLPRQPNLSSHLVMLVRRCPRFPDALREREEAAGGERAGRRGQHAGSYGIIGNRVQHRQEQHGNRLAEVDQAAYIRMSQDVMRPGHVRHDHCRAAVLRQQRSAVCQHHGVVVDIDHARIRLELLSDLMHVLRGRQAAAHVQELPDPGLTGQEPHHPVQKQPVLPGDIEKLGELGKPGQVGFAVDGKVVLAAQPVVVHPGRRGHGYRKAGVRRLLGHAHASGPRHCKRDRYTTSLDPSAPVPAWISHLTREATRRR